MHTVFQKKGSQLTTPGMWILANVNTPGSDGNKKRSRHQGRCPHYTGKTTNKSSLTPSIGHDKPRTLNALLSANVVSHWAKEQIALDLILTFYSIHSATPGWTTLLSSVSFICFPILGWQLASLSVLVPPPKSLNKWSAVDMNLGLTFITPHKLIVPTYGWTNKESPPKNLAALRQTLKIYVFNPKGT